MPAEIELCVNKTYGGRQVVGGVKLRIAPGELFGLLGPSGSGKSTILGMIAGLVTPDEGFIRLGGRTANDPRIRIPPRHRRIGMVFQELALWPHMTVEAHLRFVAPDEPPEKILKDLEIEGLAKARPATLSGGEAQRVAIARAIATRPEILLLDEPLGPLDRRLKVRMLDLIVNLHRQYGTTTVLVSHDYEEAFRIADRVAVLDEGRLVQVGTPSEVYARPATRQVAELSGPVSFLAGHAGSGQVECILGRHKLGRGAAQGKDVLIVLRPDNVGVEESADGPGCVAACHSLGDRWEIRLDIGREAVLARSTHRLSPGTRVRVKLPETLWTVPVP